MATGTDYEKAYVSLMEAFGKAMKEALKGDESAKYLRLENKAFDLAKKLGWDWENDEKWAHWALKATSPEIIAHGLAYAIQRIRL